MVNGIIQYKQILIKLDMFILLQFLSKALFHFVQTAQLRF